MKRFRITVDGKEYDVKVEQVKEGPRPPADPVRVPVSTPTPAPPTAPRQPQTPTDVGLTAPMPGTIINILVKLGDRVEYGQALLTLEAMKMENSINAPKAGTVTDIAVNPGQSVDTGQILLTIG